MRFFDNNTGNPDAYYEPNSFDGPIQDVRFAEPPLKISGDADRYNHRDGNDDYTQPGNLFRLMSPAQQQQLFTNIAGAMNGVPEIPCAANSRISTKPIPQYANGVAQALQSWNTKSPNPPNPPLPWLVAFRNN